MVMVDGIGLEDRRFTWLPDLVLPDTDGVMVVSFATASDMLTGQGKITPDYYSMAARDLLRTAFCAAVRPDVTMVVVHRQGQDLERARLALAVGLRLSAWSGRSRLVLCGAPLDEMDVAGGGRRVVAHEVLMWMGDLWEPRQVWEIQDEPCVTRREVLGLGGQL